MENNDLASQSQPVLPESIGQVSDTGWRPIGTAPKDGRVFHVWANGYGWPEAVRWATYDEETAVELGEEGYWTYAEDLMAEVTDDPGDADWSHWRDLPAPPSS